MNRLAIIFAAPDHRVAPDLIFWLMRHGFTEKDFLFVNEPRDQNVAYNFGFNLALGCERDLFVFADCDMHPFAATDSFFRENKYAVQCVRYPTEHIHAWGGQDAFHTGIWRASRATLTTIQKHCQKKGVPVFKWNTPGDGAKINGCACSSLASHAKDCGLSTGWVGDCGHLPRAELKMPAVICYDSATAY